MKVVLRGKGLLRNVERASKSSDTAMIETTDQDYDTKNVSMSESEAQ